MWSLGLPLSRLLSAPSPSRVRPLSHLLSLSASSRSSSSLAQLHTHTRAHTRTGIGSSSFTGAPPRSLSTSASSAPHGVQQQQRGSADVGGGVGGGGGVGLLTSEIRAMRGFVIDMDGVLYHMQRVIPGALQFIAWLQANDKKFLFLTNSSERSPRELQEKLGRMGIEVNASHFYTSALATASFLHRQRPQGTAYVIGEPGLISALYDVGYSMNDSNPDYVVVGETRHYSYAAMELAVKLVRKGARLIGTNCDITDRSQDSFVPACGALVRPIEMASGRQAYFIGKPNPLMMRAALSKLGILRNEACILGDRMDTDILAGIQSEIRTVLILTGVTSVEDLPLFPYRPDCILPSVGHVLQDSVEVLEQPLPTASPAPHPSPITSAQANKAHANSSHSTSQAMSFSTQGQSSARHKS